MYNFRILTFILILFYFQSSEVSGQEKLRLSFTEKINWDEINSNPDQFASTQYFPQTFENADYTGDNFRMPVFSLRIPLETYGEINCTIRNTTSKSFDNIPPAWSELFEESWQLKANIQVQNQENYAVIELIPIMLKNGLFLGLEQFTIDIELAVSNLSNNRNGEYTMFSALMDGTVYKIPIIQNGMYKIDKNYLLQQGIDINEVNPVHLQLFGNGGGPLPELLAKNRIDDLHENPMQFYGNGDAIFDDNEYFVFYAEGADVWEYDYETDQYDFIKNIYDRENYYFLKVGNEPGKRISAGESVGGVTYFSAQSDVNQVHERELTNLLAQYDHTEGTGQVWYGESFFSTKTQQFASFFDFDGMIPTEPMHIKASMAARNSNSSTFSLTVNNTKLSKSINGVNLASPELQYARHSTFDEEILLGEQANKIEVSTTAYQAWLDKISISFRRFSKLENTPLILEDKFSLLHQKSGLILQHADDNFQLWDISDPIEPTSIPLKKEGGENYSFTYTSQSLKRFIAFKPDQMPVYPGNAKKIDNQNIHEIFDAEMLIIYHKNFLEAAEKLAEHRRNFSNLNVKTVDIEAIYNEFSSGRQDPTAIRNFAKMVYDRNPELKFLLLFGDGSYDYKSILNTNNNDNFIPVYETKQSLNPISGYVSDDYFALLSDNEGAYLEGDMDISIGRLPARNTAQAYNIVNKIINYETSPTNDGEWQNRIALIADDEDFSKHLDQTETISKKIAENHPVFNLEKIYLDAFQQEVNPGGHRYPAVTKSINDNIFKGVLVLTYIGHGGPGGFAQERILKLEDIYGWNNETKLPLLITATCSFTGFDDPAINTAGEATILKETGGMIALFSTVRLVYSGENSKLMNAVFDQIFTKKDGKYPALGEVLKYAKNNTTSKDNKRKFFLFGDPAMQLAIPEYSVYTSKINEIPVGDTIFQDTLRALSRVRIEGFVGDENGQLMPNFNGIVYPTVFDKKQIIETLENDPKSSKRSFEIQKQVLFKGSASVVEGQFAFEFIIPKDIDYRFGKGKISYFYSNGDNKDGAGTFQSFIIGGSSDENIDDDTGPEVELFMNHKNFVSGDITNNRPVLLAYISDDSGINVSGTSIGHDLNGMLDNNIQQQYTLNDFFQSNKDDFTNGLITFPLDKLEAGLHKFYVEAWDVLNNKGDAEIEFVVADEEDQVLSNIFNYPNPLDPNTKFYFEHTLPDTQLDVQINIFDLGGKLVKVIDLIVFTDGFKVNNIEWDGKDQIGNKLSNGIYVYNVQVLSGVLGITLESEFQKLVVIK